jgi:hypothetical protein
MTSQVIIFGEFIPVLNPPDRIIGSTVMHPTAYAAFNLPEKKTVKSIVSQQQMPLGMGFMGEFLSKIY